MRRLGPVAGRKFHALEQNRPHVGAGRNRAQNLRERALTSVCPQFLSAEGRVPRPLGESDERMPCHFRRLREAEHREERRGDVL